MGPICVLDLGLAVAAMSIVPPNQTRHGPRFIVPLLASADPLPLPSAMRLSPGHRHVLSQPIRP